MGIVTELDGSDLSRGCQTDPDRSGEHPVPRSVLAPESALGSVPTGALSSARVEAVVREVAGLPREKTPRFPDAHSGNIFR